MKKEKPIGPGLKKGIIMGESLCFNASFRILLPLYVPIKKVEYEEIGKWGNEYTKQYIFDTENTTKDIKKEIENININFFPIIHGGLEAFTKITETYAESTFFINKNQINKILYSKREERIYEAYFLNYSVQIKSGARYSKMYQYMLKIRKYIYSIIQETKPSEYKIGDLNRKLLYVRQVTVPSPLMKGELPF